MGNTALTDYWNDVEDALEDARLVAWDGCHKAYVAMDDHEASWLAVNYDHVVKDTPKVMLATLRDWYKRSCPLKFIQSVERNEEDPNAGFSTLIPQGAEEEDDDCPYCGYADCDGYCQDDNESDD